jgi:hypothetical protein
MGFLSPLIAFAIWPAYHVMGGVVEWLLAVGASVNPVGLLAGIAIGLVSGLKRSS